MRVCLSKKRGQPCKQTMQITPHQVRYFAHEFTRRHSSDSVEKLFAYVERLEARYTSASEHVARLTPSLLAKAFRGELVGQEAGDEDASALVERIRKAKEKE